MGVIKELLISLGLDTGDTDEKLDDLDKGADKAAKSLGGKLGDASAQAGKGLALMAAGAVAAAGAIFKLGADAAGTAAGIDDAAKRAGITSREFQRLASAAGLAGASSADISTAFKTLDTQLAMVARTGGGPAAAALKAIGLKLDDLSGLSGEDKFALIADGIANLQDPSERTAAAIGLFGGAGQTLVPLLAEGGAAVRAYGDAFEQSAAFIGQDMVDAGAELDDQLLVLKTDLTGVATQIGLQLMPVVAEIASAISDWISENHELIESGMEDFLNDVVPALLDTAEAAGDLVGVVVDVVQWFGESESAAIRMVPALAGLGIAVTLATGPWGALAAALLLVVANFDKIVDAAADALEAIDPFHELKLAEDRRLGNVRTNVRGASFLPGGDGERMQQERAIADAGKATAAANEAASVMVAIASGRVTARNAQALMLKGQRTKKTKGGKKKDDTVKIPEESRELAEQLMAELDQRAAAEDISPTALAAAKKAVAEALAKGSTGTVARDAGFSSLKSLGHLGPAEALDPWLADVLGADVSAMTSRAAIGESKITPQTLINTVNNTFEMSIDIQVDGARAPDEVANSIGGAVRRWFDDQLEATARELETRVVK